MALLDGKVAVVTGAGGGIGRAVALLLATEGARVLVNDAATGGESEQSPAEIVGGEIRQAGGVAAVSTDSVATAEGARAIVEAARSSLGGLDVLVNCAGILRESNFTEVSEADLDAVLAVHVKGTLFCSQAAAQVMRSTGGRIVNTTGWAGMLGNLGRTCQATAEAAVYGLTRSAGIELQRHGITVNAVAPLAKTRTFAHLPAFRGVESLTAEHVAPAYLFFASPLCGDRSGHVLALAGGRASQYRLVETAGQYRGMDQGPWTAAQIDERWDILAKL